jgi:XTP/dITP diphosphohydrolase
VTRYVLASANQDKAAEIRDILVGIELVPRPADVPDVDETEDTLEGNARLKAAALAEATGLPAIADDTGLFVDALDGRPGVRSARYAGEEATYRDNVDKLLSELRGIPDDQRTAYFETVALMHKPDGSEVIAVGRVTGRIAIEAIGDDWGYNPVFVPDEGDGRPFALMTAEEKYAVSHRGRAFRELGRLLADD